MAGTLTGLPARNQTCRERWGAEYCHCSSHEQNKVSVESIKVLPRILPVLQQDRMMVFAGVGFTANNNLNLTRKDAS